MTCLLWFSKQDIKHQTNKQKTITTRPLHQFYKKKKRKKKAFPIFQYLTFVNSIVCVWFYSRLLCINVKCIIMVIS